jgi:hypothetical protein
MPHDDDAPDALTTMLRLVAVQTQSMIEAAKTFQASPRDGVENLETLGRPLLHDLRSMADALGSLSLALHQTADQIQRDLRTSRLLHERWPL